ncbi:MAG: hypothetical protein E7287_05060 [Lachnospiraceae bacterium]|nr:hypothetical protein [Lachnospiraceae bacterium]
MAISEETVMKTARVILGEDKAEEGRKHVMIGLGITITLVIGVIGCMGVEGWFRLKEMVLRRSLDAIDNSIELEIEKEKTKQLEIKTNYREKYNSSLY